MHNRKTTLTEAQVREAMKLRRQGLGPYKIAKLVGANHSTIKHVIHGRSCRHVTGGQVTADA